MNYDTSKAQAYAFRLSVRATKALEHVHQLHDAPHILPITRALLLQKIHAYLMADNALDLDLKKEVLEFYIEDFEERRLSQYVFEVETVDCDETPGVLKLADQFAELVKKRLPKDSSIKSISQGVAQCLSDMRKEDVDTFAVLFQFFYAHPPESIDSDHPTSLLDDYNLPHDVDIDDVDALFREVAYSVLPQFSCLWEAPHHPLAPIRKNLEEMINNSCTMFLNLEEGLKHVVNESASNKKHTP